METQEKKTKVSPWRQSKAKKLLIKGILDGLYPSSMKPQQVYLLRTEFQDYPYERFRDNLKNLRAALKRDTERADSDHAALMSDLELHPPDKAVHNKDYPRWVGSAAETLLKFDVTQGNHIGKTPEELYFMHEEYEEFPLKVFRDHIEQEVRSRTTQAYWLHRSAKSKNEPWPKIDSL